MQLNITRVHSSVSKRFDIVGATSCLIDKQGVVVSETIRHSDSAVYTTKIILINKLFVKLQFHEQINTYTEPLADKDLREKFGDNVLISRLRTALVDANTNELVWSSVYNVYYSDSDIAVIRKLQDFEVNNVAIPLWRHIIYYYNLFLFGIGKRKTWAETLELLFRDRKPSFGAENQRSLIESH